MIILIRKRHVAYVVLLCCFVAGLSAVLWHGNAAFTAAFAPGEEGASPVVVVDAGHGGEDGGAVAGIWEFLKHVPLGAIIIPVVITVYSDRSFSFITKTPPAAVLIKKECNIESGSGVPNKTKVATISKASIQKIAEIKMKDLNAASLESAMSMIAGTCRSMGVVVGD